ncbi:MAG: sialate O-acetylesterase, partial [Planctomycetota bacterium]
RFAAVGGRVRGVLWYQGETDACDGGAAEFARKLRAFVPALRGDLGRPDLPFLYVQIGRVFDPSIPAAGWNMVREAQRACAGEIAAAEVVPAVDLPLDDPIHLSAQGQQILGRRLARLTLREVFGREDIQPGPRPARVTVEPRSTVLDENAAVVRVTYEGVDGSLRAPGEVRGFSVRDSDGGDHELLFNATIDPAAPGDVLLRLSGELPEGACLWYGYGRNPCCNLTDELDMGALAFGPWPLEGA